MASLPDGDLSWESPPEDIENAIRQACLASTDPKYSNRIAVLDRGSVAWLLRYQHSATRNESDLHEAELLSRAAARALLQNDPNEGLIRSHLGGILLIRSEVTDDSVRFENIIEEALSSSQAALKLLDPSTAGWSQTS